MKIYPTGKTENFRSKCYKLAFNLFPAYRRTGGRIRFLSGDWKEVQIALRLSWKTRNYVGSVFGGSIYGALDPIYMVQLINILGKDYVVWDKAANIRFIRPVKGKVCARFVITDELLDEIKAKVAKEGKYVIDLPVDFRDKAGNIYAEVTKTLYIADKEHFRASRSVGH